MGCTSSTPKTAESQTSTTDDLEVNVRSEATKQRTKETDISSNGHKELDQIEVLPECEIRNNQTQLSLNNKNHSDPDITDSHMDIEDNQRIKSSAEDTINLKESTKLEEKLVSLREVVEKIILDKTGEEDQIVNNVEQMQNVDLDRQFDEIVNESNENDGVHENDASDDIDDVKESTSPAQSEDSRATRWEALADIAAELPPSLAVDPLTGQIYSLTK